jgi:hypothetical protein
MYGCSTATRKRRQQASLAETTLPASLVSHPFPRKVYSFARDVTPMSLFALPNVPLDRMPTQTRPRICEAADFAARFFERSMLIDRVACTIVAHWAQHAKHAPSAPATPVLPAGSARGLTPTASRFSVGAACARRSHAHLVLRTVVCCSQRGNDGIPTYADAARASVRGATALTAAPTRAPRRTCSHTSIYLRCSGMPRRCRALRVATPCGAFRSRWGTRDGGCVGIQGAV